MLTSVELNGFKSFGRKCELVFTSTIAAIVGPNGSGKSNVAEGLRFVLGEQSMKSLRSKRGEDLIWGGSHAIARQNRASVKVVFDNTERRLDIDFPEVILERVVYRDGQNEYLMNGTKVRLKDVIRLLAGANIGGSGYQIISQGEADRILNASPRERREMVEDALGLKLYQHKKAESERKLEETAENIEKSESLRRELVPHLKFLGKQVEKIEKAKELKEDLAVKLSDYLAREHAWVSAEDARLQEEEHAFKNQLAVVKLDLENAHELKDPHTGVTEESKCANEISTFEIELKDLRAIRDDLSRELGRAEGALEAASSMAVGDESPIARQEAEDFALRVEEGMRAALSAQTLEEARSILERTESVVQDFLSKVRSGVSSAVGSAIREHEEKRNKLAEEVSIVVKKEAGIVSMLLEARAKERTARDAIHAAERTLLSLESRQRELQTSLASISHARGDVARAKEQFEAEVREGIALIGAAVHAWEKDAMPQGALSEDRREQERRRRDIERLKIKIEEYGGGGTGDDVVKEFNQTRERDEFLGRELADLVQSEMNLRKIIEELDAKMDERFTEGLGKINEALQTFFEKLFNGGSASLDLEKPIREKKSPQDDDLDDDSDFTRHPMSGNEEEEPIAGLAVSVQLPRKKVRGLEVLSGGERALTSIAMIFAMSQVNPPPFLILDETDAALDEANSRRYADMITALSKSSQLIIITHNRATMASAGELYGVTMGQDGVSKLLSVKLEEAERVAK